MPDDFPAYVIFVTQHSLLAFTTSLTDISSDMHDFFVRLNYGFAVDRVMRSFVLWGMPHPAAAAPLGVFQSWLAPASQSQKQLSYFGGRSFDLPVPPYAARQRHPTPQDSGDIVAAIFAGMQSLSDACLKAAPAAMDAWRISARA